MVSEATVQAQAEQLKDYRELLGEWSLVWRAPCCLTNVWMHLYLRYKQETDFLMFTRRKDGFQWCHLQTAGISVSSSSVCLQQRQQFSRTASRSRWTCRTWATRPAAAVRTRPRGKTRAARVSLQQVDGSAFTLHIELKEMKQLIICVSYLKQHQYPDILEEPALLWCCSSMLKTPEGSKEQDST